MSKFTYTPEEDNDGDCTKIWHNITLPDGRKVVVDEVEQRLELWLELGMPARIGVGPLDMDDLKAIKGIRESGTETAKALLIKFHGFGFWSDEFFETREELARVIREEMPFILAIENHEKELA